MYCDDDYMYVIDRVIRRMSDKTFAEDAEV